MRRALLTALLLTPLFAGAAPLAAAEFTATPIPLEASMPGREAIGGLVWRGGLALTSDLERFGGLSGIEVLPDGTLVAISDLGWRFDFEPVLDEGGRLVDIIVRNYEPLTDVAGKELSGKQNTDAESLAMEPDGTLLVAFERDHRIGRLHGASVGDFEALPAALAGAPSNGGVEAMTALSDGRLLILTEQMRADRSDGSAVAGWIGRADEWVPIRYPISLGYLPTAATTLPSGEVLVLERHYTPLTGVAARIRRVAPESAYESGILTGSIVAALEEPVSVDNMEGIAARDDGGPTLVYLISDDNLNRTQQRTLLMMFELAE